MDIPRYWRAIKLQNCGQHTDALREFELLTPLTSDPQWKCNLLVCQTTSLWQLGRLQEARQRLAEAILFSSNVYTEHLDACLTIGEGKRREGMEMLAEFLKVHPDLKDSKNTDERHLYFDACERLGYVLFESERYAEAISFLDEALTDTAGHDRRKLCYFLGVCNGKVGSIEKAKALLTESLSPDPNDPLWVHGQYQLGCLYAREGKIPSAIESFKLCKSMADTVDQEFKDNLLAWLSKLSPESKIIQ
jgi:tetratricopeptide (TPR) repeat protein